MTAERETDAPAGLQFVEEPGAPDTANFLLYGPPKSGKSSAAATAPGPILWLSAEGPGALAYARKIARERNTRIMEVRLTNGDDAKQTLREILLYVKRTEGKDAPVSVVVDTLAKVREALIVQLVQQGSKNSLQQYGEVAKVLREFVRVLRDMPVNMVLIAHQEIADADGDRIVRPLVGGALTEELPGEVDVLAYTHSFDDPVAERRRYVGQLVEAKGRVAGDRSGGLGPTRDLDLSEWLSAYQAALEGDLPWGAGNAVPVEPEQLEVS